MKLGKIYDFRDIDKAKKLIGKRVVGSDCLEEIINDSLDGTGFILNKIKEDSYYPFCVSVGITYQFIREVIEEEPILMTNRQLAEWIARGNGQYRYAAHIDDHYLVFVTYKHTENSPVPDDITIRSWGSDEWVRPTVDIYERDCIRENK